MALSRVSFGGVVAVAALIFAIILPAAYAQAAAPTPGPSSEAPTPAPSSDGTSIDQGIAYVLMLVALVLTYLIHSADFA